MTSDGRKWQEEHVEGRAGDPRAGVSGQSEARRLRGREEAGTVSKEGGLQFQAVEHGSQFGAFSTVI